MIFRRLFASFLCNATKMASVFSCTDATIISTTALCFCKTILCFCHLPVHKAYHPFIKVPADHKGDAGIEAFTLSGIVYQCYCPEKDYTVNELYEHLRDKATTDIGKLIDPKNAPRLKKLGLPPIREPKYFLPLYNVN